MGQYLSVGIVTRLSVLKKEMEKGKIEQAEVFEQLENTLYFPIDIYDVTENDNAIILTLKNDVFMSELLSFLRKFYKIMYPDKEYTTERDEVIEKLRTSLPADWMDIAENKSFCFFQKDKYGASDKLYFEKDFKPSVRVHYDGISLSTEGKIFMEEYGRQFNFVKYCMKAAFKEFAIAGALRVYITG